VRRGVRVTLIDAWGPGNPHASSGGETRVLRASYGTRTIYTRLTRLAIAKWRTLDDDRGQPLFRQTGALFMFSDDDGFGRASAEALGAEGLPFAWYAPAELARRYPQISPDGISSVLWEPEAGVLLARQTCDEIVRRVVGEGGQYRRVAVASPVPLPGPARSIALADDSSLKADAFVFACGPWLGQLFPAVIGDRITPTRQEIHYFGTAAGDTRFTLDALPVWAHFGDRFVYGIPGDGRTGFKVADDTSGPRFDPTTGSRELSAAGIRRSQTFLHDRFPAMADAPLVGGEVCQYEATPDSHLIIDRHPDAGNVWLVGGGSGHGFKLAPAVGEIVADVVLERAEPDPQFSLSRFGRAPEGPVSPTMREKWS
jgi:glycine/D-amino acid oxidase-like deaminating enzyme